ncbi:MAG: adenosylmethionine decarboxylase [Lentisphaerae bacterium]|jgi:S-adenosylmethionine decarboxylase|nr:adenosylmethionine decarboxylase [Lentisphaerota bacterium]MBT4820706.1 adenosylmethionine decarboxylase [Lentisphaerota bacterium]MBT5612353.1 adenosylmethionine decarboxylase [Lentisphaerota bacterium]MBT7056657.1 adenosylmethionine decarboxylase [Lentisphaerota bacterium]MBT7840582.1 adenosylmethionine decarboxylase [Lentisphaerota bacterium]
MAELLPIGCHLVVDLAGIAPALLTDDERILALLQDAVADAGFRCLDTACHRFEDGGGGFTAMLLLAESHVAIHTYPEFGYAAVDVFTCGPKAPEPILAALESALVPRDVRSHRLARGPGSRSPVAPSERDPR